MQLFYDITIEKETGKSKYRAFIYRNGYKSVSISSRKKSLFVIGCHSKGQKRKKPCIQEEKLR